MKTHYVLGFLFSRNKQFVALIKKNKPEWQKGLLNGIGGKVEGGEDIYNAMQREFKEETGVDIERWLHFAKLEGEDFVVDVFKAFNDNVLNVNTMTEETVYLFDLNFITLPTISNIPWLLEMALDDSKFFTTVIY